MGFAQYTLKNTTFKMKDVTCVLSVVHNTLVSITKTQRLIYSKENAAGHFLIYIKYKIFQLYNTI